MRRETRINLIFLAVFVIVALPGAVILFKKKLDPSARRLDQPDPILHRLPYMSPLPAPPDIKWITPDKTQAWVRSLTAPVPTLSSAPPGPEWEPVISPDHKLQVLAFASRDDTARLTLLLWTDPGPTPQAVEVAMDEGKTSTKVLRTDRRDLPEGVRHELVNAGFIHPPKAVLLLEVDAHGLAKATAHQVAVSLPGTTPPLHSAVDFKLPAAPAASQP